MEWFGDSWGALICKESPHQPTPVGAICPHCAHSIKPDDQGVILPFVREGKIGVPNTLAYHLDCFLDSVGIGGEHLRECDMD